MGKFKHATQLRDLPPGRSYLAIIEEIRSPTQTDRGVAIIGAACADLVLREAITDRLRKDENLMSLLFENRGPLQAFSDRIQFGYALEIYESGVYGDLRAVKDIRNAFAHSAEGIDFSHPGISQLAMGLLLPRIVHYRGRPDPTTPRERYVAAIELVTDGLMSDMTRRARGVPEQEPILRVQPRKRR